MNILIIASLKQIIMKSGNIFTQACLKLIGSFYGVFRIKETDLDFSKELQKMP